MSQGQIPCRCPSQILNQIGCQCEASGHCRITPRDAERLTDDYARRMLASEPLTGVEMVVAAILEQVQTPERVESYLDDLCSRVRMRMGVPQKRPLGTSWNPPAPLERKR